MNQKNSGISVILPALNEEHNIEELSIEIMHYFEHKNIPYEIIIVNDGSLDKTGNIADELASKYKTISAIHHPQNRGYGKSLKDGFEAGKYEYLFFTDADRQFRINSLDTFLPQMQEGKADLIIGYRIDRKDSAFRKFLAWCFNSILRILFHLDSRDVDCAFKLFKKESFNILEVKSNGFLFNAELLAKARIKQLNIIQRGVEHYPRSRGKSTISLRNTVLTIKRFLTLHREIKDFERRNPPQH